MGAERNGYKKPFGKHAEGSLMCKCIGHSSSMKGCYATHVLVLLTAIFKLSQGKARSQLRCFAAVSEVLLMSLEGKHRMRDSVLHNERLWR